MTDIFRFVTPVTYWILIALWSFILYFYVKKMWGSKTQKLFLTLIIILAIDAFRTLFESVYFGIWNTSLSGFIPKNIGIFLMRPELVIIPKVLNVIAAIVVITLLLKRWLPKEEEEQLRQDNQLRAVVDNSVDAIGVSRDGIHTLVNPAYLNMFGYEKTEELLGKPISELIAPSERKRILSYVSNRITNKIVASYYETRGLRKDGTEFDMEVNVSQYGGGGDKNTLVILRDITKRKFLEEQLRHAQKMEAIGTLAGGIAHDFNNILSAILGYTELARDESPSGSVIAEDLDKVLLATDRAKGLVQHILAFSRQADVEYKSFQPASIVEEAITMLRPTLPTTIEIVVDIDSASSVIFADPNQINQIVMNLCTNAFHAMEKNGGRLNISLKETKLTREDLVEEPDVKAGTFLQFSVSDTGSGISPEIKGKVFDPFFTTKETGKGTGMGLSIIHGIVKSLGGFVSLYSQVGQGTTFHVFFPVIEKGVQFNSLKNIEPAPTGKERILFIDDEEVLAQMGKDMLERLGYRVTVRKCSLEALETFQNQPDKFDLVITDQTMPGMAGIDLARRMLQIRPDIPIILCTGYSSVVSEEKAKFIGIREFALKPLSKKNIAELIRKVLGDKGE